MKWKKSGKIPLFTFAKFQLYWAEKIEQSMLMSDINERQYQYLLTCNSENVEYFCPEMIAQYSIRYLNQGLKAFYLHEFEKAKIYLLDSARLDPINGLIYWNLARIFTQLNGRKEIVQNFYNSALKNLRIRKLRGLVKKELLDYHNNNGSIPIAPVQVLN